MNGISIVIISRGREKLLEELFESVETARKNSSVNSEVILVDSSLNEGKENVHKLAEKFHYRYFYQDITVSAKRNYGAAQANYDVILFLDSDCIVTPNILNEYQKVYAEHPDAGGAAGPLEFIGEDTWFWKVVEKTPYTIFFSSPKWGPTVNWAPTANFSVKKEVFLSVGGFDEGFPKNPGGEDVDMGMRLSKAGHTIYSVKDALVYHSKATWSPVKAMYKRAFHYGAGDVYLMERYYHMSCTSMPKRIEVILFAMLFYIFLAVFVSPWLAIAVPLIPVIEMAATSLCVNILQPYKATSFGKQFAVQSILLFNEAGYVTECIKKKHFGYIHRQIIHFKPQMDGICYQNMMTAMMLEVLMLLTAAIVFILI